MIIEWAWERLSAYKPLIISIKNKMVCQGHPAVRRKMAYICMKEKR